MATKQILSLWMRMILFMQMSSTIAVAQESVESTLFALPASVWTDSQVKEAMTSGDHLELERAINAVIESLPPEDRENIPDLPIMLLDPRLLFDGVDNAALAEAVKTKLSEAGVSFDSEMVQIEFEVEPGWTPEESPLSFPSNRPHMSVAEAVAQLPEELRIAVADYHHLLEDEWTIIRSLSANLFPLDATRAVLRVLHLRYPDPESHDPDGDVFDPYEMDGSYFDVSMESRNLVSGDFDPLPETLLTLARRQQAVRSEYAVPPTEVEFNSEFKSAPLLLFRSMSEYERVTGVSAPALPAYAVPAGTEGYIGPWSGGGRARVYADSLWGAPLVFADSPADDVRYSGANRTMFGRDAKIGRVNYRDNVWCTYVMAFDGLRSLHVEVATRLDDAEMDEFIRFVRDTVEVQSPYFAVDTLATPSDNISDDLDMPSRE